MRNKIKLLILTLLISLFCTQLGWANLLKVVMYCGGSWKQSKCPITATISGCVRAPTELAYFRGGQLGRSSAGFESTCDAKITFKGDIFQNGTCDVIAALSASKGSGQVCAMNKEKFPNAVVNFNVDTQFRQRGVPLTSTTYVVENPQ